MPSTVTFCFPTCHQQWFQRNLAGFRRNLARFQQNLKKWPESHEFAGIRRNPVNPLLRCHVLGQIYSSPTSLGPKKIRKRERKKKKTKAGQISPNSGEFVLDSSEIFVGFTVDGRRNHCWGHFGKKKLKVPTLREIETLGGHIVNF